MFGGFSGLSLGSAETIETKLATKGHWTETWRVEKQPSISSDPP
jgi:hypothetical protein